MIRIRLFTIVTSTLPIVTLRNLLVLRLLLNLTSRRTPLTIRIHLTHHLLLRLQRPLTLPISRLMRFNILMTLWSHLTHMLLSPLSLRYLISSSSPLPLIPLISIQIIILLSSLFMSLSIPILLTIYLPRVLPVALQRPFRSLRYLVSLRALLLSLSILLQLVNSYLINLRIIILIRVTRGSLSLSLTRVMNRLQTRQIT
jgi:hypothetical protein